MPLYNTPFIIYVGGVEKAAGPRPTWIPFQNCVCFFPFLSFFALSIFPLFPLLPLSLPLGKKG